MDANPLRQFVHVLLMGEIMSLRSTLTPEVRIDDPTLGSVGADGFGELAALWRNRGAAHDPKWVALTTDSQRSVAEFEIRVDGPDGPAALPVAAVAVHTDGLLSHVRLYHSFWPLEGAHRVREPVVDCAGGLSAGDVVSKYQEGLAAGDVSAVLACFGDGAYVREPAGGRWLHRGLEGLNGFYSAILRDGGIPLEHCSVTDDGVRCAIEYVVRRWGSHDVAPQAGVAVYERNGGGLLGAARIYDDIEPPL